MPYSDPKDRAAQQRHYAQTPEGKAARRRSHQKYLELRQQLRKVDEQLQADCESLAEAMQHWRAQ